MNPVGEYPYIIALALCGALVSCSSSDTTTPEENPSMGRIEGSVLVEDDTLSAVPGAVIAVSEPRRQVTADEAGNFVLNQLPIIEESRRFVITAAHPGFEPEEREVVLSREAPEHGLTFDLTPTASDGQDAPGDSADGQALRVSTRTADPDEVRCVARGETLGYIVEVENPTPGSIDGVVIHDTLSGLFASPLRAEDIDINRDAFPDADVTVDPDRFAVALDLGRVPTTAGSALRAYTIQGRSTAIHGAWCNVVSSSVDGARSRDQACVVTPVDDGVAATHPHGTVDAAGAFTPSQETVQVGAGGPGREGELAYRIRVTNRYSCFALTNVRIVDQVGPTTQAVRFRELRAGFPDEGTVGDTSPDGFTWTIPRLDPGESAEIQFLAEAVETGDEINRFTLTSDEVRRPLVYETTIRIVQ